MHIVTIANEKGGVGKTTITVNLAAALGLADQRVMVIDLDSQAHATEWLGIAKGSVPAPRSAYGVLAGQTPLAETVLRTKEAGVAICAAHPLLAKSAQELGTDVDGLFRLRDALQEPLPFDVVLIDCPPSKGAVVFNALIAADLVLAPVQAEALNLEGLGELMETAQRVRSRYSPQLPPPQIVINNYEGRSDADRQIQQHLRDRFGAQVCATVIGRDAPLRECFAAKASVFRYRRTARSARQLQQLAAELQEVLRGEG